MAATLQVTGSEMRAALTLRLGAANNVLVEDEALGTVNTVVYYGTAQNWKAVPPPQITVDGILVPTGSYTVTHVSGLVTFGSAREATEAVMATYWFAPFSSGDIDALLTESFYALELFLGKELDATALPRAFQRPLVNIAYVTGLQGLLAERLDNYKWTLAGDTVDRNVVASVWLKTIDLVMRQVRQDVMWARFSTMAGGAATLLNIDRQVPPSPYSRYVPVWW